MRDFIMPDEIKNEMQITFEGEYLLAISRGYKDLAYYKKFWTKVRDACVEYDCYLVLMLAHSLNAPKVQDVLAMYKFLTSLRRTLDSYFRVAWVEQNPEYSNKLQFVENFYMNRGFHMKLFDDIDSAKEWLLK